MQRILWCLLTLALLCPVLSHAQCPGQTAQLVWLADELKPVSSTATPLTAASYQTGGYAAQLAVVQVQLAPVVYRLGTNPTAAVGGPLPLGASFPICGLDNIKAFKAIRQTSTDSLLFVNYYRSK
jgi:hypothetical protein